MFDLNRLLQSRRAGPAAELKRMLEWKLLRGSHEFPGPRGGTCVNEAAIVAAGYPYRPVYCVKDMPASFSRPIAMLALCLNDTLEDAPRQELLMPFVTRLGGTADAPGIEMMRAELVLQRAAAEILAPALARIGHKELAEQTRASNAPMDLVEIARRLRNADRSTVDQLLLSAVEHVVDAVTQWRAGLPTEVVFCAFSAMRDVASLDRERCAEAVYRQAVAILDGALEIGNRAEASGLDLVAKRMNDVKREFEATHRDGGTPVAA